MSQKVCSLQGGYLLTHGNKYLFRVQVKLVNVVDRTLVYALSPILSLAHTALAPRLELGVLNGWICHMFTVSITALILRCTLPFILTCVMWYGPLYGCSYILALLFLSMTISPTW
jgi:hypothetical protein